MARYNMNEEVKQIAEITGKAEEKIAEELELEYIEKPYYGDGWYASNRKKEFATKKMLEEAKRASFRAARNGNAKAYTKPFFTRDGDGWAVVARGVDFVENSYGAPAVRVRRGDGSVGVVEVIDTVDTTSEEVRVWAIR